MEEITDTQRLDFILKNGGEWQGFSAGEKAAYEELEIRNGETFEIFEAPTRRECIDKAIKSEAV